MKDSLFLTERNLLHKWALLTTIPCAVGIMMFASSIVMKSHWQPTLFSHDYLLALPLYGLYTMGLWLSYKHHRNIFPFLLFGAHVATIVIQLTVWKTGSIIYFSILTILLTSVVNQYHRTGSTSCEGGSCLK